MIAARNTDVYRRGQILGRFFAIRLAHLRNRVRELKSLTIRPVPEFFNLQSTLCALT